MPPPESAGAIQDIVYWPPSGYDDQGRFTHGTPVQVRGRWNTNLNEQLDTRGNRVTLDGQVSQLSQAVAVGGLLWLGSLDDWNGVYGASGSGATDTELVEVKTAKATPDVKGRQSHYEAGFLRYGSKP